MKFDLVSLSHSVRGRRILPSQLRRLLSYDPSTGTITRSVPPREWCESDAEYARFKSLAGRDAVQTTSRGCFIRLLGVWYQASRVAYYLGHGIDPDGDVVIQRDGDRCNLVLSNLALADRSTLQRVSSLRSGATGYSQRGGRYIRESGSVTD